MTAMAVEPAARPRPPSQGDVFALADRLAEVAHQLPVLDANGRAALARDLLDRSVAGYGATDGLLDALQQGCDAYTQQGHDSWFLIERCPAVVVPDAAAQPPLREVQPASWFLTVAVPAGYTHPDSDDGETVQYDRPTLTEALTCGVLALAGLQPKGVAPCPPTTT